MLRNIWLSFLAQNIENPVLIDKYIMGTELEVDAICDGDRICYFWVLWNMLREPVFTQGDSIAVYPAWNISDEMTETIVNASREPSTCATD